MWRELLFVMCLCSLVLPASRVEAQISKDSILDPTTGEIDGHRALAIYPVRFEGMKAKEVLQIEGCEVHLVPSTHRDQERVHPCATWFLEEPGHYDYWIEAENLMSPYANKVVYKRGPFKGRGMPGTAPIGPAGRVILPVLDQTSRQLRLLHAGSYRRDGILHRELTRRMMIGDLAEWVQMPEGPTVAFLWDTEEEEYIALSRPFEVMASATVEAPLETPPEEGSQLVAQLIRGQQAVAPEDEEITIELVRGAHRLQPSVRVLSTIRATAIWYHVPAGTWELRATNDREGIRPLSLELRDGSIQAANARMEPLPSLEVALDLPSSLLRKRLSLQIRRQVDETKIDEREVASPLERFEGLPPERLEVVLETPYGPFLREVDLTSISEGYMEISPELVVISGRVFLGDEATAADLSFTTTARETRSTHSDAEGHYEIVLLDPVRNVEIGFSDDSAPFVEFFPEALTGVVERDFRAPDQHLRARVFDSLSGQGIEGARVFVRSSYLDEDTGREMSVSQDVTTSEEGMARLPPVREGFLELTAAADGYSRQMEPKREEVTAGRADGPIFLPLDPEGPTSSLQLQTSSGQAADGARIALFDSLHTGRILDESAADAEGNVELPKRLAGAIALVRHAGDGFLIRIWDPGTPQTIWRLPRAVPLAIQVVSARDRQPVRQRSIVTLHLGDWILSGIPLTWATGSHPFTDPKGLWQGSNLPAATPVSILITPRKSGIDPLLSPGLFTEIGPGPWPHQIRVERVDG